VFDPAQWTKELSGATGVVSCIGAFGSDAFMEKINGDANVLAVEEAAKAGACLSQSEASMHHSHHRLVARVPSGVPTFVYVSTVENNLPEFLLRGYFHGKKRAEAAVLEKCVLSPQTSHASTTHRH
jgi:hypothetical protein